MNFQQVLSQVITKTNEIFEAEAGSVALLEPDGQHIVFRAAVGEGADAVRGLSLPVSKGVIGWVASQQKPALIPDVTKDDRWFKNIDQESGFHTKSIMCVPLQVDGHTIGVIELMNMRPDYLSEDGLKILNTIADHAALAIENARLLEETRQRSEEQALLFESMAIVTSDLAVETVLDAVSRQMVEALRADLCMISRWQKDENQLRTIQCYAVPGMERPEIAVRLLDRHFLARSVLEVQATTLLETFNPALPPEELAWLQKLNVEILLLIPLIYRRQTIGLVEIGRRQASQTLTQHEIRLAETMTAQAAVAIEHARLYDETTHHLAEAKVLQEVMVAAASSLDFDQVLSGTIAAIHRTLGVERLGFFLPTTDSESVVPHPATIGFDLNRDLRIRMDGSAAGWVIRNRKPLLLQDVRQASHYYELAADTRAEVCVPVIVGGQVAAVLNAESPRLNAFDQDDLRLFVAIAAELAVALENARLFEKIRTAEVKYRDLFDNANDLIFILDSNFRVSSVNNMTLKATGYAIEDVVGAHLTNFTKPKHRSKLYRFIKEQLVSPASPATFELPILGKNGREILLEVTVRIQRKGRKAIGIHCIARDITQRRELERQLQQTEKLSTTGKLVAGVAHELNNPLTTIIGYATLLQKSDLPAVYREDVDAIFRQAQRAQVIVRDLLTFARNVELETSPVDINHVIQDSLSLTKPQLQTNSVETITCLDPNLPQTMVDPHQLEQVFVNLIINAIQTLDMVEGPRRLRIESRRLNSRIHLSFADNGPGIPEEILNRVFDPFFTTKEVGQGTGLGLSICFGIISEHNGQIRAKNNPQGGAVFHIDLPITEPTKSAPVGEPSAPLPETTGPDALRILVVDDEAPILNLLNRVLAQGGRTVDTALDGKIAWEKINNQTFDLVICDVLMPDIAGPELYQKTAARYPHLADNFIFITGNVVDLDTHVFLEKSGLRWLSKPFLPSDLERAVKQVAAKIGAAA
ncbi:MAG: GAF domain-containing protein [Anaerolineae bacterium]|nr:GAF domain-containing protein [Anaerolineae bacterium]